jgi:hypothetical protein
MSVDSSPWILPNLPRNEDMVEQGTPSGEPVATGLTPRASKEEQRERLLKSLHEEAAGLRRAARIGKLGASEQEYLADLQREIDHYESSRPSLREGDLWKRIDELAERVLAVNR